MQRKAASHRPSYPARWDDLRDVQDLVATLGAFAARTGRGSVVIWGSWDYGGPCEAQEQVDVATGKVG